MSIIEFAEIQLLEGTTADSPLLLENMRQVKKVIEDFSGLPTRFVVDQDDRSKLYVIGGWETVEQHSKGFSGSKGQNEILALIKDQMTITWQYYVDIDCHKIGLNAADIVAITLCDIKGTGTRDIKSKPLSAFARLDVSETDGRSQHTGGWALPGSMTEAKHPLWVQIASFPATADLELYLAQSETLIKRFEEDHHADVVPRTKVVRLLQLR